MRAGFMTNELSRKFNFFFLKLKIKNKLLANKEKELRIDSNSAR